MKEVKKEGQINNSGIQGLGNHRLCLSYGKQFGFGEAIH